ncbi:MAG: hypothetical protein J0H14_24590 [Alphaproteobacteria bacterium]|nr:hypothetical protein [Alphaproteobacteria bacterium]
MGSRQADVFRRGFSMWRFGFLALLFPLLAPASVIAGDRDHAATLTGKERLSDKASDEQRVDDCKVPPERRTRHRPTACPWDLRS